MAKTIMEYIKNQILLMTSQAILAQSMRTKRMQVYCCYLVLIIIEYGKSI